MENVFNKEGKLLGTHHTMDNDLIIRMTTSNEICMSVHYSGRGVEVAGSLSEVGTF